MIIIQARNTIINIIYQGSDITKDIAPYLLTFTFTDNSGGKADDLSITLQDASGTWLQDWMPSKGDIITATIIHAETSETVSLPCGTFSVDQIDYSYPPSTFSIKGVSASVKKKSVQQKKSSTWENVLLPQVITEIAGKNSLAPELYSVPPEFIEHLDQIEQSDLEFLQKLCADYGLAVKVQESKLVVYDIAEYEESASALTIEQGDERLLSVRFTSKTAQVYRKARVRYHDPVKDELYDAEYEDDAEEGSERELEIYERVESQADAERVAEERLIDTNRKEITGSVTLKGDVNLAAGLTVELSGFGMFSGKHFINKCTHKVDNSGYTTVLELGQPQSEKGKSQSRKASRKTKAVPQELFYEGEHYY